MKALVGCAGFGGVDIALRSAGIETVGIELDPAIAEVNRFNGGNVITADLLDIDPSNYIGWLLYHFSPPCPSFSVANHGSAESEIDIALARKICDFIRIGRPEYFTLENVWMYRKSLSWALVRVALLEAGYAVEEWHLNSADYGVPQTRRRMIAIARRDGQQPPKPWPTHSKVVDMFTERWRGWYEIIEDLIPDLPLTQFAPWQAKAIKAMPDELMSFLLGQGERSKPKAAHLPADTITANTNQTGVKGFIANGRNTNRAMTIRGKDEPMMTVTASDFRRPSSIPKAFIVDCQNNGGVKENGKRGLTIRGKDQPMFTMTASANRTTIRAGLSSGCIVSMSVRCLARFQDFPDWFVLPGEPGLIDNPIIVFEKFFNKRSDRELACRGIGNALPPGLYRAVLKSLGID